MQQRKLRIRFILLDIIIITHKIITHKIDECHHKTSKIQKINTFFILLTINT